MKHCKSKGDTNARGMKLPPLGRAYLILIPMRFCQELMIRYEQLHYQYLAQSTVPGPCTAARLLSTDRVYSPGPKRWSHFYFAYLPRAPPPAILPRARHWMPLKACNYLATCRIDFGGNALFCVNVRICPIFGMGLLIRNPQVAKKGSFCVFGTV